MRTCTGCRAVVPQRELVRVAILPKDGGRLVLDRTRRLPGRGAYVHPAPACVTAAGLARSLRRAVNGEDVRRLVSELSLPDDNSQDTSPDGDDPRKNADDLSPGLAGAKTVETPPRIKAKDDRSEDARV
ncbi:MAG TPA: YlxR family protein [Kofleriaceae bacterium]|nr:YlxR family protein [Kofleriaceae bacterium]